jgi:putative resolvase
MKLSDYAKQVGVTYQTAWQWGKAGYLGAYQLPTGTILVRESQTAACRVALEARVSCAEQQEDAVRQPCAHCNACGRMRLPVAPWWWLQ